LDPVRYLANQSSGELGCRIIWKLLELGATVDALIGPGAGSPLPLPAACPHQGGVTCISVETPNDLFQEIHRLAGHQGHASPREPKQYAGWIHAMAVLDYVPAQRATEKISSEQGEWAPKLVPTPKIIRLFKDLFPESLLVGFKLLTSVDPLQLREAAFKLATAARCDLVVANPAPFAAPASHQAWFLDQVHQKWSGPVVGKEQIADNLVQWIRNTLR
jgi:phosphopantothenoylcysteine synthetase/decarboxylase